MDHIFSRQTHLEQIEIFRPDDLRFTAEEKASSKIILAVHNGKANTSKIISLLKDSGYMEIISLIDLYSYLSVELGDRYWLTDPRYYQYLESVIEIVYQLWADDFRKEIFSAVLRFRISGDFSVLPEPDLEYQYFPPGIVDLNKPLRVIDCGAYNGDPLLGLLKAGGVIEAFAAFEHDIKNFNESIAWFSTQNILLIRGASCIKEKI